LGCGRALGPGLRQAGAAAAAAGGACPQLRAGVVSHTTAPKLPS
jgi:hypothetical protein